MPRNIATTLVLAGPGLSPAGCRYSSGDCGVGVASMGGDIGAVSGVVTRSNDIDLGCPFWR
jgi:hypothetical protein